MATKLEAFHGRGGVDLALSHDLEDIMTVIDGRPEIVGEIAIADTGVRTYIASEIAALTGSKDFLEALAGFLLPDSSSQARQPLLKKRLEAIAALS